MRDRIAHLFQKGAFPGWMLLGWFMVNLVSGYISLAEPVLSAVNYLNQNPLWIAIIGFSWLAAFIAWPSLKKHIPCLNNPSTKQRLTKLEQDYEGIQTAQKTLADRVSSVQTNLEARIDSADNRSSSGIHAIREELNRITGNLSDVQSEVARLRKRLES